MNETAIRLACLVIDEINAGSPRWLERGGQSHGWTVLEWLRKRYEIPRHVVSDIVSGFLIWR